MSFIKLGSRCLKKSKIVSIDAYRTLTNRIVLEIDYDEPYAVATGLNGSFTVEYSATMSFQIPYPNGAEIAFVNDIREIRRGNTECIIEQGVTRLLKELYNKE